MNDHDRSNLNFLLNASKETLNDWHVHADEDDLSYAMELLRTAQAELMVYEMQITDDDAGEDLSAAQSVLAQFRL